MHGRKSVKPRVAVIRPGVSQMGCGLAKGGKGVRECPVNSVKPPRILCCFLDQCVNPCIYPVFFPSKPSPSHVNSI